MGLLDTVLDTKDSKKKSFKDFLQKESALKPGDTYPAEVLKLFSDFFGIKKCILLIYSKKEDLWLPVAQTGLDVTSGRRIRFNNNFVNSVFKEGFNYLTSQNALQNFKHLLSIREYSTLENISFLHKESAAFLGLNSGISGDKTVNSDILEAISHILEKLSNNENRPKTSIPNDSSIILFTSQYLSKYSETVIFLIKLQYEELISFISESSPEKQDVNQVSQDIFDTVYSMVNISGRILQIDIYSSLLLFSSKSLRKPELLTTQIESTLKNYFNIQSDLPVIKSTFVSFPEDGMDAEALLTKLDIL